MTGSAIRTKTPLVLVIGAVTGITILRCVLEVSQTARIGVTFDTGCLPMFPGQLEFKGSVAEVFSKRIHPVMTIQASRPIGQDMRLGEESVHLTVTSIAGVGSESRYIFTMTIYTSEGFILDREPVSIQCIPQQLMRELPTFQPSQGRIRTTMFRMAIAALEFWIILIHGAMQSNHGLHLGCDLAVTIDT